MLTSAKFVEFGPPPDGTRYSVEFREQSVRQRSVAQLWCVVASKRLCWLWHPLDRVLERLHGRHCGNDCMLGFGPEGEETFVCGRLSLCARWDCHRFDATSSGRFIEELELSQMRWSTYKTTY